MDCPILEDIIDKFSSFTKKPVDYLTVQTGVKEDIKNLVKTLYDFTKTEETHEKKVKKSALPELIVEDFDEEQIWQEIELQNAECWDQLVWEVANCITNKNDLLFPVETSISNNERELIEENSELDEEEDQLSEEQVEETPDKHRNLNVVKKNTKRSIVDDQFFKLQEMENFLVSEEKKEGKTHGSDSEEESIDMFEDIDEDESDNEEGGQDMMYTDFFDGQENSELSNNQGNDFDNENGIDDDMEYDDDEQDVASDVPEKTTKKKGKKVTFADKSSDDDDESEEDNATTNGNEPKDEKKSEFELRQQRLKQQISKLEDRTLKEAPWQLKGEVDASKRPQNSLLQEVVDFDLTSRPAPIITEQTTLTLEDIIRRRIKDKAWDDVIRKEKPVDDQLAFRKTEIIDHSKSKQSLAQVYEAEYLKQKQALSGDIEDEKEPESHTEIRESMSKLFAKLDALCHYHYTPKAPQAEVKIVSNTPAISMEEVAPLATSEAALLAPEEVKKKRRGELMNKEERTQTDRNRERRKKKKLQQKKGKVVKVTNNRNTKIAVESSDKSLKTSKAFFQQLNDDSTSLIKSKNKRNVKNKGQ